MRRIETQTDVDEGAAWLAKTEPRFAPVLALTGPLPLRLKGDGYPAILSAIVSQQVSTASAAAIWARVVEAGLTTEAEVLAAGEDGLRACGFSRPKIRYALAIAEKPVDWPSLQEAPDDQARAALIALPGIGPWTAEIYLLSSLGRPDVFPAGDLALQEAAKIAFDLDQRPSEKAFAQMAEPWSPWRAVAARALWAYYRHIKGREGVR
ncbi:MAG: DNA-3-methyladenine glycosylase 2 family protein [Pseudomonadota bacterium]